MKQFLHYSVLVLLVAVILVRSQELINSFSQRNVQHKAEQTSVESKEIKFKVDTAMLTVAVVISADAPAPPVDIYSLSDNCFDCLYYRIDGISGKHQHLNTTFLVDTKWGVSLRMIANLTATESCNATIKYHYGERGVYVIRFHLPADGSCSVDKNPEIVTEPWRSNMPILYAFLILLAFAVIYTIIDYFYSKKQLQQAESIERYINSEKRGVEMADLGSFVPPGSQGDLNAEPPVTPTEVKPKRERLTSIDTFRGLCILIMIFVNYKGGRYWFFHHSAWNGLTVADLVFPWFMFIMGVNIVFSIDSLLRKSSSKEIAYKIVRRTLILYALGLFIINHSTDFIHMRIPGVLQRFAIAYLVVALLQWAFHKSVPDMVAQVTMAISDDGKKPWWYHFQDIIAYWPQWLIVFLLETLWTCLTFLLPVPGCPTGYLGPGGLADQGLYPNCTGGAAGYIDRKVFGDAHIYGHSTAKNIYFPMYTNEQKVPFDPEGLLGSIHSCLIVFLGLQAGKIFLYHKEPGARIVRWLCWSLLLGVISAVLTKCSQNEGWIPVNKNLWSTTFVTTLSCMAFFITSVMYYIIDVKKIWTGAPFFFMGMNSIFLYVGHEVFTGYLPFAWGAGATSTHAELLAMNMLGTAYWVVIAYYCYKIEFFVKI